MRNSPQESAHQENTAATISESGLALEQMSRPELEDVFLGGQTPDLSALVGWDFCGLNVPGWAKLVGIKKFIKGFFTGTHGDVFGYNCPTVQGALLQPWRAKPSDGQPKRFGFYRVTPVDATARDNRYLHAVLLNYGEGGNKRLDPTSGLRDYLVQVYPNNDDLYLGKAYYALGPARVYTNFFILQRRYRAPLSDPR